MKDHNKTQNCCVNVENLTFLHFFEFKLVNRLVVFVTH